MSQKKETIWTVVFVQSGVIVDVKTYRNEKSAERRASLWRNKMHEDDDDIQIFETKI